MRWGWTPPLKADHAAVSRGEGKARDLRRHRGAGGAAARGANATLAANLALAGDWTDTGLPATIEGAIRSGRSAADVVLLV